MELKNGSLLMKIYYFSKNTKLCLPLPQPFQRAFAHKSKH